MERAGSRARGWPGGGLRARRELRALDILILGGTRFLGRALAECALARGHRVTLFHRGRTAPELFPGVERILGDREHDLDRLDGRSWDAVFDTCGFFPRAVRASAERLAGRVGHYTFVSSISVYVEPLPPASDESAPLATLFDETVEQVTGETYGALKARCERAAEAVLPGRVLHARAGLLVGPNDYTDRFPYWVQRIARGGDVLVPDAWDQPLQFIDVRDAAAWMIGRAEARSAGTFNLSGPAEPLTLGAFFEGCRALLHPDARFIRVAESFLLKRGIAPWSELPLWTGGDTGHLEVELSKARALGLELRPLEATIRDTLEWSRNAPPGRVAGGSTLATPQPGTLRPERERELLAAWADQSA